MSEGHVSRTVCVSTNVSTIEQAFAFVITHMDAEGLTSPHIEISPCWQYTVDSDGPPELTFAVQVQGEQVRPE
jgi:hypothetical protein